MCVYVMYFMRYDYQFYISFIGDSDYICIVIQKFINVFFVFSDGGSIFFFMFGIF